MVGAVWEIANKKGIEPTTTDWLVNVENPTS